MEGCTEVAAVFLGLWGRQQGENPKLQRHERVLTFPGPEKDGCGPVVLVESTCPRARPGILDPVLKSFCEHE